MEEKIRAALEKHAMLQKGDNVIVAFSGGADSMALFHFLFANRAALGITLAAAHFEHGLRGEESLRDAEFVKQVCAAHGVPLYVESGNMAQRMARGENPPATGTEEWARRLRYAFFGGLAAEHNAKIALAHTKNDNAETVLFHIARGTGPKGLSGIPPVRGPYVRPLIEAGREDVEAYCAANGLRYVEDSTNTDKTYSRNLLRHEVLPLLEQAHPGALDAVERLAGDMRQLSGWLDEQAGEAIAAALAAAAKVAPAPDAAKTRADILHRLNAATLAALPQPLLLAVLAKLAGPRAGRVHLALIEDILQKGQGAVQLPGGVRVRAGGGLLVFAVRDAGEEMPQPAPPYEYPISPQKETYIFPHGKFARLRVCNTCEVLEKYQKCGGKGLTFVADYGKISKCSVFRPRKSGDRISPCKRGVTKALKKWMNEEKIPTWERDDLPLMADGDRVLWIWGHGFAEGLAPDGDTTQWLVLRTGQEEQRDGE